MIKPFLKLILVAGLLDVTGLVGAQTLTLDSIGVGSSVTVTGSGGPPASSVELFRNGISLGSVTTTAYGLFSFPGVTAATNDQFYAAVGQVWNFSTDGNFEGWNALAGDASVVSGGTWKQTNSTSTDMSVNLFGDGQIKTRARVLEVRVRFQGGAARTGSVIMQTAGTNGVAGGGDDRQSTILNTFTLTPSTNFQTLVFDLGIDHNGAATCWLDGTPPINLNLYVSGVAAGESLEIDSIRLTEAMRWEFDSAGDLAEWQGSANTTLLATNAGTLILRANASGSVAMSHPFRLVGSTNFVTLQTRFRQVTTSQPNTLKWNYFSNPSSYGTGGKQFSTPANGAFQILTTNLTGTPAYGNAWTNGGGATLSFSQEAYGAMTATASGQYAEVDYVRLLPAAPYGPSSNVVASGSPVVPSYYVSSSLGNDFNSGRDSAHPWATFTNLDGLTLGAGTTINLLRGDTWTNSRLHLTGKGTTNNPITLTAYGLGAYPLITGLNTSNAACIQWENPAYVRINSMNCRDAKVGLYLRYAGGNLDGTGPMFNNADVQVTCCHFQNMNAKWSDTNGNITVLPPYELSFGAGIWIGGNIPAPDTNNWPSESTLILDGLTVTFCGFQDVSTGLGINFYFPSIYYKSRFTNLRFEDSWVTGCENGSFALCYVNGGDARRVDSYYGGTNFYSSGTTAGFIQHSKNFAIADCEFSYNKRNATGNDGVGFDYEGNTTSVVFTNNVVHDNDGAGILILNSISGDAAFNVSQNTFWNNCRNAKDTSQNYELRASSSNTGMANNNGVYRGAATGIGAPGIYDNAARWGGYTNSSTTRTGTLYSAVSTLPTAWYFTSSVEGWGSANQWSGFGWSGGALVGTSSGVDPYASSGASWVNTRERRWVHVRMSQTAGVYGQIFFQLETDPTFSAAKAVFFPIIPDGVMHDYIVDMGTCASYQGVVTQWRLDPTDTSGSTMAIDTFEAVPNPYLASVTAVSTRSLDVRFNQMMLPAGGVFSPGNFTLSGAGQGTLASNPANITILATTNGATYRLTWNSGDMTNAATTLTAANALNSRAIPLWSGSQITFTNSFAVPHLTASPTSDILVTSSSTPNPATIGSNITATITVKNLGADAASSVMLTNTLPSGANLISASTTQGTLATNVNVITANLGALASNATATVTLVFAPAAVGNISVTATASSTNLDPNTTNNSVSFAGFVEPLPLLSIAFNSPDQVQILWSGLLSNWVLQAKADLTTNTSWSNVLTAPVLVSGTNTVTETNTDTVKFYRLQR